MVPAVAQPLPSPPTTPATSWPAVETPTQTPTKVEVVDTPAKDIPLRTSLLPLTDERLCDVTETLGSMFLVPSNKTAEEDEVSTTMRKVMEKLNKGD